MPPRTAPTGSSRGRGRGSGRGIPISQGGGGRGGGNVGGGALVLGAHVSTVGVKRPSYGKAGMARTVLTNHFEMEIPKGIISHYDVVISPSEKALPARLNMDLIAHLQQYVAPNVFTPRAVYDGRKNMFASTTLQFPSGTDTGEFDVQLTDTRSADAKTSDAKGPKVYKIKLRKVAEINPETLARFLQGQQSHDNDVLTAITALNVVIRMEPSLRYPFNVRSFFTDQEKANIGKGLELWRGYFQSIRPAPGRMLVNVDISTGTMYKAGPLLDLCLEFVDMQGKPNALAPRRGFPERERLRLQRFISGIRVRTTHKDASGRVSQNPRVVKKISKEGASQLFFSLREGGSTSVAAHFQGVLGRPLKFPDNICVEVGSGALIPIELCDVTAGQIMRKQVPPELTKSVLEFATRRPEDRLRSIRNGLTILAYGQSEYVRQFGMHMPPNAGPLEINARVLPPPVLKYNTKSRNPTVTPKAGAWNMIDKKFFEPKAVVGWVVVVYENQRRFNEQAAQDMIKGLLSSFQEVGMACNEPNPIVTWPSGQGNILDHLNNAGREYMAKRGKPPTLIVCILPEGATDLYTTIKHFGDCVRGVATQCMKSSKCFRAKPQYYANVCLKINVKLGGINVVPDPASVGYLTDSAQPTLVLGADVIHPAPGSEGRPSFTALVGNCDSMCSRYVADTRIQTSRQEMIDDLEEMTFKIIEKYRSYRREVEKKANFEPKRIILFRDGVSEGQFQQVLDIEVPRLKSACAKLGIKPAPKLTVIVVAKRHHVRFFPKTPQEAGDKSGNAPAGLVVDSEVTNPAEFDFYLQSHGGLLGTSRPAHYNVLLDENAFSPDGLQQLCYTLCHVYARSTRSVSIPAPVYYADTVCSRAKNHFNPQASQGLSFSDSVTDISAGTENVQNTLEMYKKNFVPLHVNSSRVMYFS